MKEIFIGWIMFQLIMIGIAGVSIHNEQIEGTYKCPAGKKISVIYGAIFPLALFAIEDRNTIEYCKIKS